jgi:hypothetical protein
MSPISDFRGMSGFELIYNNLATRPYDFAMHSSLIPTVSSKCNREKIGSVAAQVNFLSPAMRNDIQHLLYL